MKKILSSSLLVFLTLCFLISPCARIAMAENDVGISSRSGILMDYASGEILFAKNAETHLPVASMVKMMTILIALEEYDANNVTLDTMISTTENASGMGGSQVFIDPYVEYSFEDLLKSVIMASANDASVALAEHISGSEENFVRKMNEKAKEMGLKNTNFMNSTGLPAVDHYSSACDISKIYATICDNKIYKKYSKIWMTELIHPSKRKTDIVNTNRLIRTYEGCDSGKTGFTSEAGFCLSASATRGGMMLIGVVIGADSSKTRFNEMANMFNYGFASYENKVIIEKDKAIAEAKVTNSKQKSVNVYPKEDFVKFIKKGEDFEYSLSFNLGSIKAPKQSEDGVGKLYVLDKNNIVVYETELVIRQDIEEIKIKDILKKIYTLI